MNLIRFRAMIASTRSPVKFLVALFLTFASVPSANTQDHPDVGPLASQVAASIEQSNAKSAVVFEFTGPDTFVTPVGGKLADDLSDVLATSSSKFKVIDRVRAVKALESNRLAPEITADQEVAVWLTQSIGAEVAIVGRLSREGENVRLTLDCLLAKNGEPLKSSQTTFLFTDKWKSDLAINIDPDSAVGATAIPGKDASIPHCTYCPHPEFPRAVRDEKMQGTAIMKVVVGADGKPRDIRLLKTPGHGLTVAAIQAVQKWRFKAARGADGRPMETQAIVEAIFSAK